MDVGPRDLNNLAFVLQRTVDTRKANRILVCDPDYLLSGF